MTLTMIMMIVWLSVFVIALISELVTDALVSVWFCIGAIVALGVTFIPNVAWWVELIVFVLVSILAFISVRPFAKKFLYRNRSATNIDNIIGKKGIIIKDVTFFDYGEVKVNGVIWTAAKYEGSENLKVNDQVEVVAVDGNKLIVRVLKKEEK